MRTTICQAAPRTQLRRGAAVGVSDPGDGSFPLKWLLPGQPAWEHGCLECSGAGDRRGRLGRSRRELALQAGARLWKWDVNEGFLWGRGVGGGSEPAPQVQHASQWVGTQCRHFFPPLLCCLAVITLLTPLLFRLMPGSNQQNIPWPSNSRICRATLETESLPRRKKKNFLQQSSLNFR